MTDDEQVPGSVTANDLLDADYDEEDEDEALSWASLLWRSLREWWTNARTSRP